MKKLRYVFFSVVLFLAAFAAVLLSRPQSTTAAGTTMANLVVFIRFEGTTDNVFQEAWTSAIQPIYDDSSYSFSDYIRAISDGKLTVKNVFPQRHSDTDVRVLTLPGASAAYDQYSLLTAVIEAIDADTDPAAQLLLAAAPSDTPEGDSTPTAEPTQEGDPTPTAEPTEDDTPGETVEPTTEPTLSPTPTAEQVAEPAPYPAADIAGALEAAALTGRMRGGNVRFAGEELFGSTDTNDFVFSDTVKLDYVQGGVVDNLTLIVDIEDPSSTGSLYYPHHSYVNVGKTFTLNGQELGIGHYNMINTGRLMTNEYSSTWRPYFMGGSGLVTHEFLHSIDFTDLYDYAPESSSVDAPVGGWDIMASTSNYMEYPLSYFRSRKGWIDLPELTADGTYTLQKTTAASGTRVYKIATPLSDTEFFLLEYRYDPDGSEPSIDPAYDCKIPETGLIVYRINNAVDDRTNRSGGLYAYVMRKDATTLNSLNAEALNAAALNAADPSFGTVNLSDTFDKGTIYYSDGQNSGIAISEVAASSDGSQISFKVAFADYSGDDNLWSLVGTSNLTGAENVSSAATALDASGVAYAACETLGGSTQVYRCVDGAWSAFGGALANCWSPQMKQYGQDLYLAGRSDTAVKWYKLGSSGFASMGTAAAVNPFFLRFTEGDGLCISYTDNTQANLVIRNLLNNGALVSQTLTGNQLADPAVCKLGSDYYVLYAAYFENNNLQIVKKLSGSAWSEIATFTNPDANRFSLATDGTKLYGLIQPSDAAPQYVVFRPEGTVETNEAVGGIVRASGTHLLLTDGPYVCYEESGIGKVCYRDAEGWKQLGANVFASTDEMQVSASGGKIYAVGVSDNQASVRSHQAAAYAAPTPTPTVTTTPAVTPTPAVTTPGDASYVIRVTPPSGYTDTVLWIDGIARPATQSGGMLSVDLAGNSAAKTVVMYSYKANGVPNGMYVWSLKYANGAYTATAVPALRDLLSYHGFSVRVVGVSGIRFKTGIVPATRAALISGGLSGYRLVEYGTLSMFESNRSQYPLIKGGENVWPGRAYWTEGGRTTDLIFETKDGRYRFTSVLVRIPANQYATDFAFRGYIVLQKDGEQIVLYGPVMSRSIYAVAKQVLSAGEFARGSAADKYLRSIVQAVEG